VTTETTWDGLPTVTGFAVGQAIAALRKRDIATAPLLRRAGLSERDYAAADADPLHHRISAIRQAKFLDHAADATGDSVFGLHLAEQTDPRSAGILFYVASGARDLDEALKLFGGTFGSSTKPCASTRRDHPRASLSKSVLPIFRGIASGRTRSLEFPSS
jgi:hypothetical protein